MSVISGLLQREVYFHLLFYELTALGNQNTHNKEYDLLCNFAPHIAGDDYVQPQNTQYVLNSSRNVQISIPIISNDIYELTECFLVNIIFSGPHRGPVQSSAKVIIFDDDGK